MIHGGIDGFSRIPVYLAASTNNRSETFLECFLEAEAKYGLPSRVRSDKVGKMSSYLNTCCGILIEVRRKQWIME